MTKLPAKCIGLKKDMTVKQLEGKHIARGGFVFATEEDYLNHVSPLTGFKPTQIQHQDKLTGGRFSKVSAKALERGESKK